MWAPLIGPRRYDSEGTRAVGYDMLDPTVGQSVGAAWVDDWVGWTGLGSLLRAREMNLALDPNLGGSPDEIAQTPGRERINERQWKDGPSYRDGLSYFDGMTTEAARLLAERHDARTRREDILNRTEGYGINSLVLATRLAAQVADPIGIAASFIPVVGQARYARLLAQLGRPGARLVTGAVEGAVGNALLEPLVYAAAQQDQIDYGMVDSLINVGIGGAFGAGLRVAGGAVADLMARRGGARAATAAADTAIIQAASGQEIDVRPVLRAAEEAAARPNGTARTRMEVNGRTVVDVGPQAPRDVPDAMEARRTAERQAIERDREVIRRGQQEDALKPRTLEQRRADAHEDLLAAYPSREVMLPSGKSVTRKGPMDLASFIRASGGIQDAPELRGMDINRKPRDVQFAKGEQFMGALVRQDGMTLEQAAQRAADAGYIGRTFDEVNEYGETGARSQATTEEFVDALNRTLGAGENLEGRVWGVGDEDQPLHDYFRTMRDLDEEEAFTPAREERWQPLTDEDVASEGAFGDLDEMDFADPEALWREEMERAEAAEARPPEDPRGTSARSDQGDDLPSTEVSLETIGAGVVDRVRSSSDQEAYVITGKGEIHDLSGYGVRRRLFEENYHDAYRAQIAYDYERIDATNVEGAEALIEEAIRRGELEVPVELTTRGASMSAKAVTLSRQQLSALRRSAKDIGVDALVWRRDERGVIEFIGASLDEAERLKGIGWGDIAKVSDAIGKPADPNAAEAFAGAAQRAKQVLERERLGGEYFDDDPPQPAMRALSRQSDQLTPEQEIELDAERYRAGVEAAAACMARTL